MRRARLTSWRTAIHGAGSAWRLHGSRRLYSWPSDYALGHCGYLGGERAQVVDITREGCDECDSCKEDQGCLACSDCDECDAICKSDCIESVTFVVPVLPEGPKGVVVYNGSGSSNPVTLNVTAPFDTGDPDTGGSADDSGGPVDTGAAGPTD